MKHAMMMVVGLLVAVASYAQPTVLEKVWTTAHSGDGFQEVNTRVDKLVTEVGQRHYRDDIRKLYALFKKTHSRFLHSYVRYTNIEELANGRYDCLTATSLFADILTKAGYKYKIIETNYHIFMVVNTADGTVVLETTDRFGGFIDNEKRQRQIIDEYKKNILAAATAAHYQYSFKLFRAIDPNQLPGLLYFNQAVNAFNAGKWNECSEKLSVAGQITNSPRIAALATLLNQQASSGR